MRPTSWKASATAAMTLSGDPFLYLVVAVSADVDIHAVCIGASNIAAVCLEASPEFAFAVSVQAPTSQLPVQ